MIIDITYLNDIDLANLYAELKYQLTLEEFKRTVVVHISNQSMDKTNYELIKFFGR